MFITTDIAKLWMLYPRFSRTTKYKCALYGPGFYLDPRITFFYEEGKYGELPTMYGYVQGGVPLQDSSDIDTLIAVADTNPEFLTSSPFPTSVGVSFAKDAVWSNVSFTAWKAVVYVDSDLTTFDFPMSTTGKTSKPIVGIFDFETGLVPVNGEFKLIFSSTNIDTAALKFDSTSSDCFVTPFGCSSFLLGAASGSSSYPSRLRIGINTGNGCTFFVALHNETFAFDHDLPGIASYAASEISCPGVYSAGGLQITNGGLFTYAPAPTLIPVADESIWGDPGKYSPIPSNLSLRTTEMVSEEGLANKTGKILTMVHRYAAVIQFGGHTAGVIGATPSDNDFGLLTWTCGAGDVLKPRYAVLYAKGPASADLVVGAVTNPVVAVFDLGETKFVTNGVFDITLRLAFVS